MTTPLQRLNKRFRYQYDKDQYGRREYWAIMLNQSGPLVGDCEDYALTALWFLEDQSPKKFLWALLTKKAKIWFCHAPNGEGHAVLEYHGMLTDNWQKKWCTELKTKGYDMKYPFSFAKVVWKLRWFLWDTYKGRK